MSDHFRSALVDFLDPVSLGYTPTAQALEQTLDEALAGAGIDSGIDRDELRRGLTDATRKVLGHARDGDTGTARQVASEELARLTVATTSTTNVDTGMKAVVDSIPRTI